MGDRLRQRLRARIIAGMLPGQAVHEALMVFEQWLRERADAVRVNYGDMVPYNEVIHRVRAIEAIADEVHRG